MYESKYRNKKLFHTSIENSKIQFESNRGTFHRLRSWSSFHSISILKKTVYKKQISEKSENIRRQHSFFVWYSERGSLLARSFRAFLIFCGLYWIIIQRRIYVALKNTVLLRIIHLSNHNYNSAAAYNTVLRGVQQIWTIFRVVPYFAINRQHALHDNIVNKKHIRMSPH